jgi:aminopeptidase N
LIVLSSRTCDAVAENTPRSQRVIAHEMGHRWFGGHLRPVGPATRWLSEAFAEYYAWLFVRAQLGDEAWQAVVDEVGAEAGETPTAIAALGWADDRVYTAGTLGVKALADAVGQATLDAAVREIVERDAEWSVESLFRALESSGADPHALATFRERWGLPAISSPSPR